VTNLEEHIMKITKARLKEIILEELEAVSEEEEETSHKCANHVAMKESGEQGTPINHTLLEDGSVTHYIVEFEDRIVEGIPADKLDVLDMNEHMHTGNRDDKEHDKKKRREEYEDKE
tara:strand:- start:74 stop:424 length:351 start_codon:yes stop_codon:yes gene_type:complete